MSTHIETAPRLDVIVFDEQDQLAVKQFTALSTYAGEAPQVSLSMPVFTHLGSPEGTKSERKFASQTWNRLKEIGTYQERPWVVPHLTDEQMKILQDVDLRFHSRSLLKDEVVRKADPDRDVLEVAGFLRLISDIGHRIKARPGPQAEALRSVVPPLRGVGFDNFSLRSYELGQQIAKRLQPYVASLIQDA
jgi:hypothetical protein